MPYLRDADSPFNKMHTDIARENMVRAQLAGGSVRDARVLAAFSSIDRTAFVPEAYVRSAFGELRIPLGHGQFMLTPQLAARMLEAVDIQPSEVVLEIGTGSGYVTACLAALGARVDSVECHADLAENAQAALARCGVAVNVSCANIYQWQPQRSYDAIVITASLPQYDAYFTEWLALGGRCVVALGAAPAMTMTRIDKLRTDCMAQTRLFECAIEPLMRPDVRR